MTQLQLGGNTGAIQKFKKTKYKNTNTSGSQLQLGGMTRAIQKYKYKKYKNTKNTKVKIQKYDYK